MNKILTLFLISFALVACQGKDNNEKNIDNELGKSLDHLKITYESVEGKECNLELIDSGKTSNIFYIKAILPHTNQLIHQFYTPKKLREENLFILNYAELSYENEEVDLSQLVYEESSDELYKGQAFQPKYGSIKEETKTFASVSFDAKMNEFVAKKIIKTTSSNGDEVIDLERDWFIINNCVDISKKIKILPTL